MGEFLVFTAALLPNPAVGLSALAIYQLTNGTCYQPPGGLRVAVASRVGRALGAGNPREARRAYRGGLWLVLGWIAVPSVLLLNFPAQWARFFTDDVAVAKLLARLAIWLVVYVGLDAILAIGAGALTGCGRQKIGGKLAVVCYVGCGLPAALALAFSTPLATVGIAAGHTLGKLAMTCATALVVARTRWSEESNRAVERVREAACSSAKRVVGKSEGGGLATGGELAGAELSAAVEVPVDETPPTPSPEAADSEQK